MAKKCLYCGGDEGWTDINYAGLNVVEKSNYPFPNRIKKLVLPGNKNLNFLCSSCANNYKIECKVHGIITDDIFELKRPPRCKKCDNELKSINNGNLPKGFKGLITLDQIVKKSGEKIDSGYLVFTEDNEVHLIKKEVLISTSIGTVIPKILIENDQMIFSIATPESDQIDFCSTTLKMDNVLENCKGSWINFWKETVLKSLKIKGEVKFFGIVSSEFARIFENKIGNSKKRFEVAICVFIDGKLKTIPDIGLPSMESLKCWHQESNKLKLLYKVNGIPRLFNLMGIKQSDGFDPISKLKNYLPDSLFNKKFEYNNFSSMGIFNATLYPSGTQHQILLERFHKNIRSTILPDEKKLNLTTGFSYRNTNLLIADNSESFLTIVSNKDNDSISNCIQEPEKLIKLHDYQFGIFLDEDDPAIAYKLKIFDKGLMIDGGNPIDYFSIKNIKLEKKTMEISSLNINYMVGNQEIILKLLSPESLAYKVWEILELKTVEAKLNPNDTINLYKKYNQLKKKNLLIGLYSDIILFNKELNRNISMEELASEISQIPPDKFYENRKLYEATTEIALLMSIFLPQIKQNFEYLATFYPYYQLKNELSFISDAFGKKIANKMSPIERKRIIQPSRRNIRNMQIEMQRIFSEIEKAIHPLEQIFANEEIQKTISSKISRHIVTGGQLILVGSLIASGAAGGIGVLAGMLGIGTVGKFLNSLQKDRGNAARIKRASETLFSWWQVFLDLLPVSIYEAGELISEMNNQCMLRDKQILSQFPPSEDDIFSNRLQEVLHNRITQGTKNQFLEIHSGSGIRLNSIAEDIEYAIDRDANEKISTTIGSLSLPQL